MYRRPKFQTELLRIRETMSREADYDVDLFTEMVRSGKRPPRGRERNIRGFRKESPQTSLSEDAPDDSKSWRIA